MVNMISKTSHEKEVSKIRTVCMSIVSIMLAAVLLSGCQNVGGAQSEDGELVSMFRDRMTETLAAPDGENVYWVRSGSVYHLTPDCRFLAENDDVICSSVAESGKTALCSTCAKANGTDAVDTTDSSDIASSDESVELLTESTEITGLTEATQTTQAPETQPPVYETQAPSYTTTNPQPDVKAPDTSASTVPDSSANKAPNTSANPPAEPVQSSKEPDVPVQNNSGVTVYWTKSGEVWHLSRGCPSLSRSKNVWSGSIAESGKERVCKRCG